MFKVPDNFIEVIAAIGSIPVALILAPTIGFLTSSFWIGLLTLVLIPLVTYSVIALARWYFGPR